MIEFFEKLSFWHWWILAVVLLIFELFAPAAFFIWIGAAALTVGFVVLMISAMGWQLQFLLFAVLSIVSVYLGRYYIRKNPEKTDQPGLNRRGEQYIGRVFSLDTAIINGAGRVKVGDSYWRVEGEDVSAGERIKVVAVKGASFVVERVIGHD